MKRNTIDSIRPLYFIETGGAGGAETVVLSLAAEAQRRGITPSVVTLREGWLTDSLDRHGIRRIKLESPRRLDLTLPVRLASIARQESSTLIHSHLLDSNFYASMAAKIAGLSHIGTEHGDIHHIESKRFASLKLRCMHLCGTQLTSVSDFSASRLVQCGFPRSKISIIDNPVARPSQPTEAVREELLAGLDVSASERPQVWIWCHVANFRPVKNQSLLIRAFAASVRSVPQQRLLLIGDGALRSELEEEANALGVRAKIFFAGFRNDAASLMTLVDGFVLSSKSEAMPVSLLEAVIAGALPLCPAIGGIPEVIEDGVSGLLVAPHSESDLAQGMNRAVNNRAESAQLARIAQQRAEERFLIDRVFDSYLDLYR